MAYIARNNSPTTIPLDKLINIDADSFPAHLGRLKDAVDFVAPENTTGLAHLLEQSHTLKMT